MSSRPEGKYEFAPDVSKGLSRETLEMVRMRQPAALAALFDIYFDRVYGLAYRLMGTHEGAEDTTQEVFLRVHRASSQLDPTRDPGPWLGTITYNICRDFWRSRGYKVSKKSSSYNEHPGLLATLPSAGLSPESAVLAREREQMVQAAINALPEELKEVVILRDYRGMTHEEIASLTGASYAAVRKRYSRALARLGDALKDVLP